MTIRYILIVLLLSQAIFATPQMSDDKALRDAKKIFRKLSQTELGREAIISIQAQLDMSNPEDNLVDKILIILKGLLEQNTNDIKVVEEEIQRAQKEQENRTNSNTKSVTQQNDKIASFKEKLVQLQDRQFQLEQNLTEATKQADAFQSTLADLEAKNETKLAEYKASVQQHADTINGLQKARELIMQLSTANTSFLQLKPETVLLEVTKHIAHINSLGSNQKLLELTLKLSDVDIQADQEKVSTVIQIIDDLLEFESYLKSQEYAIEQKRKLMFESKKAQLLANEHRVDAQHKNAIADHKTNEIRITEYTSDIATWEARIVQIGTQQTDLDSYYNQRVSGLNKRLTALGKFNELIQKVIDIFESDRIQNEDVRNVANTNV